VLIMRHADSDHDALTAAVGVAAGLTVEEETKDGKSRFRKWRPHPVYEDRGSVEGAPSMRETDPTPIAPDPETHPAPAMAGALPDGAPA
jgi:hypothetical protein